MTRRQWLLLRRHAQERELMLRYMGGEDVFRIALWFWEV